MDEHGQTLRPWPLVAEQTLHEYSIFSLSRARRRSPSTGREHTFLRLDAPDWVNVIALTPGGRLVLVEQYRHGTDAFTLEIPGGAVDPGEQPETAAVRELEEETGYRAGAVHHVGTVEPNPAFLSNRCWTYLATDCSADGVVDPDPSEEITVRLTTLAEFTTLVDRGDITHSLVVAAHDHLQRGLRRGAPWSGHVRPWIRCG
jgi:8-oxo-dGTP pyrophosphatase MutT (NUDIX family)